MIPIETFRTMLAQTNDIDELLELKENIRKQKHDIMKQFDRLLQENMKTMIMPNIENMLQSGKVSQIANVVQEWGKQAGAKKMMSTQKDFNKTMVDYEKLIKDVSEKCSKLIWNKNDHQA
jgi:hypothetical protein